MKMFVGQIPKDWTEEDCRKLLEPYGSIHSLNILKDKDTKKSKGGPSFWSIFIGLGTTVYALHIMQSLLAVLRDGVGIVPILAEMPRNSRP